MGVRNMTELPYRKINISAIRVILDDQALYYFLLVNYWGPALVVCFLGILTNILNIITFSKQGVRDTVNISLLGLATSDLGSQITLFYTNISFLPAFLELDLPFVSSDVTYVSAWSHVVFTRISTWITAYITLERCLCVTAPLKVKNWFTPKRTVLYVIFVYVFMLASVTPIFYTARPAKIFYPLNNKTLIGISFLEDRNTIETVAFMTNNTIPTLAFCLVTICTAILVTNLQRKSKWRLQSSNSNSTNVISDRDKKVVKMVVLISAIFIICYLPGTAVFVYMLLDPEVRIDGVQKNLLLAVFSVLFHLESINAGVNIFIYLSMSSKFKVTFMNMFSFHNNKLFKRHKEIEKIVCVY
ncbi:unnamed protein product [Candidula unifasciata]|uniref:G-protein coupled receptors family 1 profile domain-containing protein n=1 Tax=Candidula unifasciata TaxID=100452 RepID=A0A8S3YPK4_9EUPU|nr:unnamed protein product [Candidula unifasciata]